MLMEGTFYNITMKKYYTPTIEEFHVGFEFEILNNKEKYYSVVFDQNTWNKVSMDFGIFSNTENIQRLLIDKQIRVKYLDYEDIEACGWKGPCEIHGYTSFHNTQNMLLWMENERKVIITEVIGNKLDDKEYPCHYLFAGEIKNKSELIRLMKQILISK